MRRWLLGVLFAVGFALTAQACGGVGCGADQQPIPGNPDAAAAASDAGVASDAGPTATDAAVPPMDAGYGDAGPGDAGPGDAGPGDAGPGDAGPVDAATTGP